MKKTRMFIIGLLAFILASVVSVFFNFGGKSSVLYSDETVQESTVQEE